MNTASESIALPPWLLVAALGIIIFLMLSRRGRKTQSTQSLTPQRPSSPAEHAHSIERWEVRMYDLQRDMLAELNTKLSALQHLLKEADERISRLEGLANPQPPAAEPSSVSPARQAVYALADTGHDPRQIAAQLNMPLGEVELQLNLRAHAAS